MDIFMFLAAFLMLIKSVKTICLPSEVYIQDSQQQNCLPTCPQSLYLFRQTCIKDCPNYANVNETALGKFCIVEHDFDCQRTFCPADLPLCYRMNCLEKCPNYTVRFENNCVLECPMSHPFLVSNNCEGPCFTGNATCVKGCPDDHPFIFETPRSTHCLEYCLNYTYEDKENKICRLKCPTEKQFLFNKTCLESCPESHPFIETLTSYYNTITICSEYCPQDTMMDEGYCVTACPDGRYEFNNTCVRECPESHPLKYPTVRKKSTTGRAKYTCVDSCNIKTNFYISNDLKYKNHCVRSCPPESNFAFNGSCVESCPLSQQYNIIRYEYGERKHCIERCPDYTVLSNQTNCRYLCLPDEKFMYNSTCQQECPVEAKFYYVEPTYRIIDKYVCIAKCLTNYFLNGKECTKECPSERKYVFNNTCNETCPIEHNYKQLEGGHYKCTDECPSTAFVHNKFYCVPSCPADALYQVNKTCVATCPSEVKYRYSNFTTITVNWNSKRNIYHHYCLAECPAKTLYNQDACVEECPKEANFLFNRSCDIGCPATVGYRILTGNQYTCLNECPSNTYIYNVSLCVSTCPVDKNYEHNGMCYQECPERDDFIYRDGSYFRCMNECHPFLTYKKTCLEHCPEEAKFRDKGECITYCNGKERMYTFRNFTEGTGGTKIYDYYCLDTCPANTLTSNLTCVLQCSSDTLQLDSKCVKFCPKERPLNYTTNKGKYSCVHSCPYRTFRFQNVCFDQCPNWLKSHQDTCTHECPKSHPYTDIRSQKCLSACENDFVITDNNICDKRCPAGKHYIEKKSCVLSCKNPHSLLQTTEQGLVCHDQCPHHLLLMENKGACVKKCPEDKLIVGSICRALYKCPNHAYLEHTDFGRRCTNKCSSGFYLDGTHCVKDCPPEKLIYDAVCANECPKTHPLRYKEFGSSNPRLKCYRQCPKSYVANGSICIEEYTCHLEHHFSYEHSCFETCPPFTAISNNNNCVSLTNYVIYLSVLLILTAILTAIFYFLTCFTGMKPKTLTERKSSGIKTHFQLISKRNPTQNNENEKYVIRYSKDDNEEAEIIEVNRQNIEHDGDEIVELNDGMEASTTFRRRNGKL